MKKMVLLSVLVAMMAMVMSGCYTNVERAGIKVSTNNPFLDLDPVLDADNNYVPDWVDDLVSGKTKPDPENFRDVLVENNRSYPIRVEFRIAVINGVPIDLILGPNSPVKIIPGYEPVNIRLERRTTEMLRLQPGEWDVGVDNLNRPPDRSREFNGSLHVDINRGSSVNQAYDAVFPY